MSGPSNQQIQDAARWAEQAAPSWNIIGLRIATLESLLDESRREVERLSSKIQIRIRPLKNRKLIKL